MAPTDLELLNVGHKPTLQNATREEVIDLILATRGIANKVEGWR